MTPEPRLNDSMTLNDEEQDILAGKSGPIAGKRCNISYRLAIFSAPKISCR